MNICVFRPQSELKMNRKPAKKMSALSKAAVKQPRSKSSNSTGTSGVPVPVPTSAGKLSFLLMLQNLCRQSLKV
jgi:hypothetical protein